MVENETRQTINVTKIITQKIIPFVVPKVATTTITIDNHMVVIQIQIEKNIVKDVLLNGGSRINIITKQLKLRLGLPKLKPAPYNLKMANQTTTKLMGLICDLKIYVHGIPYILLCLLCYKIV